MRKAFKVRAWLLLASLAAIGSVQAQSLGSSAIGTIPATITYYAAQGSPTTQHLTYADAYSACARIAEDLSSPTATYLNPRAEWTSTYLWACVYDLRWNPPPTTTSYNTRYRSWVGPNITCPPSYTLSNVVSQSTAPHGTCTANTTASTLFPQKCQCAIGDPVYPASGVQSEAVQDVERLSSGLGLTRYYLSGPGYPQPGYPMPSNGFGSGWTHQFSGHLTFGNATSGTGAIGSVMAMRPDGTIHIFVPSSGSWVSSPDTDDLLSAVLDGSGNIIGWTYVDATTQATEQYDTGGKLQSITSRQGVTLQLTYSTAPGTGVPNSSLLTGVSDPYGHTLSFTYGSSGNGAGKIVTITNPAGGVTTYAYNSDGMISTVTYPDSAVRTYQYNESAYMGGGYHTNAMTGITDELGNRYATFNYDTSYRVVGTQLAGSVDKVTLSFGANRTTVTDALGTARTYNTQVVYGVARTTSIVQPSTGSGNVTQTNGLDGNANIASITDFNGNVTCYTYDTTRNLETVRVEGFAPGSTCPSNLVTYTPTSGTRQRKISTTWSSSYRLPTLITEAGRTTAFSYDSSGNLLTKTITDTTVTPNVIRTWTYTYDSYGRVLTAQGPRTDVTSKTTYTYYSCTTGSQCGELATVTDPAGNVTTYSTYNAFGRPLTITDPNGVVTTLTYDARMRLTSRQVAGETTSFSYYATGLLKTVTLPDSSSITYTYDNAHRLTKITDGAGNYISYTLDAMGNRTAEQSYDPSSALHRTHTRVFNSLNTLYQDVNAANTSAVTTTYGYDNNKNQASITAPLSRNTANAYDELNRLKQITDPNSGVTHFTYDAEDDLTSVQDPKSLTTSYSYNGFGDVTQLVSPDTATSTNTYDSGGNLSVATDARGSTANYSYDAANRVTQIVYKNSSGVTDQTLTFGYDSGTYGKGRLTSSGDGNHALSWTYDFAGRVTGKGLTVGTLNKSIGYAYTNADLTAITTPSGQSVSYGYNTNHQITSVSVNGTTVLSGVSYEPFGGVNGWTWGDGSTVSRTFNGDGLISQIVTAGVTLGYTFDNANRITGISDSSNSALTWSYGYDLLDRLTSASTTAASYGWTYDANGNRTAQTGASPSTFSVSTSSNQLASTTGSLARTYGYDAAGHTQSYGGLSFSYNNRGRMSGTSGGSSQYLYNALGQMYEKSGSAGTVYLMYDEAGHLIGEYSSTGGLIEETVWLGDIPVATLTPNGSGGVNIFYLHTDHLNTPKKVAQPTTHTLAWRWDTDPFGMASPNQNPGGLGTFVYNLRMPGQYYQSETGLNQNINRDYDPLAGGYVESDPIGLMGGLSTYAYAKGNPVWYFDPMGLNVTMTCRPLNFLGLGRAGIKHCAVFVWHYRGNCPPTVAIDRQFSLAAFTQSPTRDPTNPTYVDDRAAFNSPGGDSANYDIPLPSGTTQNRFDASVIASGNNYSLPAPYNLLGPNSNTAATQIITGAGGVAPNVSGAVGQGWQPPAVVPGPY